MQEWPQLAQDYQKNKNPVLLMFVRIYNRLLYNPSIIVRRSSIVNVNNHECEL
jgi:hypothetical protein